MYFYAYSIYRSLVNTVHKTSKVNNVSIVTTVPRYMVLISEKVNRALDFKYYKPFLIFNENLRKHIFFHQTLNTNLKRSLHHFLTSFQR